MKIDNIHIQDHGDPSVGIPSSYWCVENVDMDVTDDELKIIRAAFTDAFCTLIGWNPEVYFDFEWDYEYGAPKVRVGG